MARTLLLESVSRLPLERRRRFPCPDVRLDLPSTQSLSRLDQTFFFFDLRSDEITR